MKALFLILRHTRNLGARRIQSELKRLHDISFSLATVHKVLTKNQVKTVKKLQKKSDFIRYERPKPGDRAQMDPCKIGPSLYQYTSIDDCTRYRVLRVYSRRTAANTLEFIDCVTEEMPFPIQRIQTDRGREFFAVKVQKKLMELGIKFVSAKPTSPDSQLCKAAQFGYSCFRFKENRQLGRHSQDESLRRTVWQSHGGCCLLCYPFISVFFRLPLLFYTFFLPPRQ